MLKTAESLGYKPNLAARSLKLNRRLRVGVYLPRQIASFFDPLREGIRAAAGSALGVNVELVFRSFPRLDSGDVELLEEDRNERFDGVILCPGNPNRIGPAINRLAREGTAVVCVASDAPMSARLTSICSDAYTSGAIAAELFSRTLKMPGAVATITGELATLDHAEKLRGFAANLALLAPHLALLPVIESHERPKEAYRQTLTLLGGRTRPLGIYISTANSMPVFQALAEKGATGDVQVIVTDLFPELIPLIESGQVLATLYQRPFAQGKNAFEAMLRHLVDGVERPAPVVLAPHIILRSNLHLFARYVAQEGGGREVAGREL